MKGVERQRRVVAQWLTLFTVLGLLETAALAAGLGNAAPVAFTAAAATSVGLLLGVLAQSTVGVPTATSQELEEDRLRSVASAERQQRRRAERVEARAFAARHPGVGWVNAFLGGPGHVLWHAITEGATEEEAGEVTPQPGDDVVEQGPASDGRAEPPDRFAPTPGFDLSLAVLLILISATSWRGLPWELIFKAMLWWNAFYDNVMGWSVRSVIVLLGLIAVVGLVTSVVVRMRSRRRLPPP